MKKICKTILCFVMAMFLAIFFVGCSDKTQMNWYDGDSDPVDTQGVNGDVYLNSSTGDLFSKVDDEWKLLINIKGEDGIDGTNGTNGTDGIGIKNVQIVNGELIITLTDNKTINAGKLEEEKEVTNTELEARQAFYLKMKDKAASFGIDVSKLTFNSAISESSGSITSQEMAKLGVMAMGYDEIAKIWNQYEYTFTTTGVVNTFTISSTVVNGQYSKYLTDYYYVLGGKTGGLATTGAGTPVANIVVAVEGPNGSTLLGFISNKTSDTDESNRFKTAKIAFDIASKKYLDKNADISDLEALLPEDTMITILALPATGNLLGYNHYDWYGENSQYLLYDYNGTKMYYSASSWKILTCMTALDYISDLDERLTITESCLKTGSGPAFSGGEQITYRDALHLILLPSSNTTCVAIATAVGQKILDQELSSSISGNPIFGQIGSGFDFENATALSVGEAKDQPDSETVIKVRGVVVGGSNTYDNGSNTVLLIKDENSNEICGVRQLLTKKNAYEVIMPFEIGDIIEIPVICEVVPGSYAYGGEHDKLVFTWDKNFTIDTENLEAFANTYRVGHTDNYSIDKSTVTTVIDSNEDLENFIKSGDFHWEVVVIRGTEENPLKAVTGASTTQGKADKDMNREYIRFYYGDITSLDEQKIDELGNGKLTSPVFSNFSNPYNLSDLLSTLLFNQTEYAQEDVENPYSFVGDVYCLIFGGSTSYYHFIVLDESCIVK